MGLGRVLAAVLDRRAHDAHQARHVGSCQLSARTPAATAMHALTHRPSVRRPHDPRPRRVGPAGRRGLVRRSRSASRWRARASTSTSCARCWAREEPVDHRRRRTTRCPTRPERVGARQAAAQRSRIRCAPTSRSSSAPKGRRTSRMATEICDGWLPLYYSPFRPEVYAESLRAREAGLRDRVTFITVNITDDIDAGLTPIKAMLGFYIGGMGAKKRNFHKELMAAWASRPRRRRSRSCSSTASATRRSPLVPTEFADEISLVGPKERITRPLAGVGRRARSPRSSLSGDLDTLRTMAELCLVALRVSAVRAGRSPRRAATSRAGRRRCGRPPARRRSKRGDDAVAVVEGHAPDHGVDLAAPLVHHLVDEALPGAVSSITTSRRSSGTACAPRDRGSRAGCTSASWWTRARRVARPARSPFADPGATRQPTCAAVGSVTSSLTELSAPHSDTDERATRPDDCIDDRFGRLAGFLVHGTSSISQATDLTTDHREP